MVLVDSLRQRDILLGWNIGKHKRVSIQLTAQLIIVGEQILLVLTFKKCTVTIIDGISYLFVHRVITEQTPLT